jgi:hypothetical protein
LTSIFHGHFSPLSFDGRISYNDESRNVNAMKWTERVIRCIFQE